MSNVVINFEGVNHFALAPPSFCFVHSLSFYPLFVYLFFSRIDCCCSILLFFFLKWALVLAMGEPKKKKKKLQNNQQKKKTYESLFDKPF